MTVTFEYERQGRSLFPMFDNVGVPKSTPEESVCKISSFNATALLHLSFTMKIKVTFCSQKMTIWVHI